MTVEEFNALTVAAAREALASCSGSARWVEAVLALRPFATREAALDAAAAAWSALGDADYAEAIAHHPRIGETTPSAPVSARAQNWSAAEQSGVGTATSATRDALAAGNAEYEARFGRRFIICASGRSADELRAALRLRLTNDTAIEASVTADELRKITLHRTEQLFSAC